MGLTPAAADNRLVTARGALIPTTAARSHRFCSVEKCRDGIFEQFSQVAKCAWFTCAATRKAFAATVKLGFKPVLEGKNEASTT